MGFPEQLNRGRRDAVLVSDSATGTVVGHRERFTPRDRPTAPQPQGQPRPHRLAPPSNDADGDADHQTDCGTDVSTGSPSDENGDKYGYDDRQLRRGCHRSRRALTISETT